MKRLACAVAAASVAVTTATAQPPSPGAVLAPSAYRYTRAIAPGPAALVDLIFDAGVLAHSRGPRARFADVRIVDTANRQIQYLLEESVDLQFAAPFRPASQLPPELVSPPGRNRSTYLVDLPYAGLPDAWLLVSTTAETFSRELQLSVERPADRRHRDRWVEVLDTLRWSGGSDRPMPVPLRAAADSTTVILTVDEGDNAPLPIAGVRLMLPGWRARYYRPAGQALRLLYGNPAAAAPEYDLALLRAKVIKERAEEISAGPEPVTRDKAAIISPRAFWGFLIAAVFALLALVARLATSPPSGDPSRPSAPRP